MEKQALNPGIVSVPAGYVAAPSPSNVYLPNASGNVPPPATGCNAACTIIMVILAFGFSVPGLIWSQFWKTNTALLAFAFVLAVVSLCNGKYHSGLLRPLAFLSLSQAILFAISALMTYSDYRSKCIHRKDLSDRTIQNAYAFDCEWGVLLIAFWTIGIVISIIMFVILSGVTLCTVSAYDRYQRMRAQNGALITNSCRIPTTAGSVLGAVLVVILFVVMMVSSFEGHPTGTVAGECAAGDDFFSKPERNDLGCCAWTAKEGTCCRQTACVNKANWFSFNSTTGTSECDNLFGLLSCSVCHTDSARFANSISNITVCTSFCEQLYSNCYFAYTDKTASDYCTQDLGLMVGDTNCFNSSAGLSPITALVMAILCCISFMLF